MILRSVIIGAGRVGSRFDEDGKRKTTWSHAGAYLAHPERFALVGAAEPDEGNRAAFARRCPDVPIYADARTLIAATAPDVISICTPAEHHAAMLDAALSSPNVKAVWCEKPLAAGADEAERMIARADERGIPVVVSYVRRWMPLWRRARELIGQGAVGRLVSLRIAMPNRLHTIGSHQVDLALFLGGPAGTVRGLRIPALEEGGEPAAAALMALHFGAYAILNVTGYRADLAIEAEAFGTEGRMAVRENGGEIRIERFAPSAQYCDYRELGAARVERASGFAEMSPFEAIAHEIAELCANPTLKPSCDARDACNVQRILAVLAAAPIASTARS
ncbi:MAG: Gfo/Idh/MocA family protein [Alphaproteobacteria bacterium]